MARDLSVTDYPGTPAQWESGPATEALGPLAVQWDPLRGRFAGGGLGARWQLVKDLRDYFRARARLREVADECRSLFRRFVAAGAGGTCLHLIYGAARGPGLGAHWVTLDLRRIERRFRDTGEMRIDLDDGYFDAILCTGLEWTAKPGLAAVELWRVLKRGGQIWVQVPFLAPYAAAAGREDKEYWRMSPDGLRILLEGYDEIFCSMYIPARTALRSFSFFYGLKPAAEPAEGDEAGAAVPAPAAPRP